MNRPSSHQKELANLLAAAIFSENGSKIATLARALIRPTVSRPSVAPAVLLPSDSCNPRAVGIWQPRLVDDRLMFVRSPSASEPSSFWARVPEIAPKGLNKRIVLLGESVARGFFYDPDFNLATALDQHIREGGAERVEIVDLARSNIELENLVKLTIDCLQLSPDVLVVFAGNNWRVLPTSDTVLEITGEMERKGWRALRSQLEFRMQQNVRAYMRTLDEISIKHGIPIIFAIPEFNLGDWHDACPVPPLIAGERLSDWLEHKSAGETALIAEDYPRAIAEGFSMIRIDGGNCPCGYQLIGEAHRRSGDMGAARQYLERSCDSAVFLPRYDTPRCCSLIRDCIRAETIGTSIKVVDIPRELQRLFPHNLPDRTLFHDYCHLTVAGISAISALLSSALLPLLGREPRSIAEMCNYNCCVPGSTVARAYMLSAIHNANWGQREDIVAFHCRQALHHGSGIADMMLLYLDSLVRSAPSCLVRSFDKLCYKASLSALDVLFDHANPLDDKFLNSTLINAFCSELEARGVMVRQSLQETLLEEHAVSVRQSDLCTPYYWRTSRVTPLDYRSCGLLSVRQPALSFRFISTDSKDVVIEGQWRIPSAGPNDRVVILINGEFAESVPASSRWAQYSVHLSGASTRRGLNTLDFRWPLPLRAETGETRNSLDAMVRGNLSAAFQCFAEIHALSIRIVKENEKTIHRIDATSVEGNLIASECTSSKSQPAVQ